MKRAGLMLVLLASGCSTAPVADLLDYCKPGRMNCQPAQFYGGVCQPGAPGGLGTVPPSVLVPTAPIAPPPDRLMPMPVPPPGFSGPPASEPPPLPGGPLGPPAGPPAPIP